MHFCHCFLSLKYVLFRLLGFIWHKSDTDDTCERCAVRWFMDGKFATPKIMLVWECCCQWIVCSCTIITATAFSVAVKCNAKWISLYLTTSCWMFMVVSGRPPPPKNYDRTWPGARLKSVEKSNPLLISSFMSAACDEWKRLGKWRLNLFVRITFGEGLQRACNCNLVHFLSDMVINHTCVFGSFSRSKTTVFGV